MEAKVCLRYCMSEELHVSAGVLYCSSGLDSTDWPTVDTDWPELRFSYFLPFLRSSWEWMVGSMIKSSHF